MDKAEEAKLSRDQPSDPPPPYTETTKRSLDDSGSDSSDEEVFGPDSRDTTHASSSGSPGLPCVIPQTTKSFRGAFYSPFVRAWAPDLEAHGISRDEFVAVIDGLNECFVIHPIFEGVSIAGGVLSMAYGVDPVQWAGMGLQAASAVGGGVTSYMRTRAYVKAVNKDFFHPAGLQLHVRTTKKMMDLVGMAKEDAKMPPLDFETDIGTSGMKPKDAARVAAKATMEADDPRLRRLKMLDGHVMNIDLDVPGQVQPDSLLKKMSATRAAKMSKRQEKKMMKSRAKVFRKEAKIEKREDKLDRRLAKIDDRHAENEQEFQALIAAAQTDKQREKITKDYEKQKEKLNRKANKKIGKADRKADKRSDKLEKARSRVEGKEEKTANKIRWLVIVPWDGEAGDSDSDSLPDEDEDKRETSQ